jgi:hypothetical protein
MEAPKFLLIFCFFFIISVINKNLWEEIMADYKMKKSKMASLAPTSELFLQFFGSVWVRTAGAVLLFIFFSALGKTGGAFAQSQFQRAIGGTNNDDAWSIKQTTDGGYAVAGETNSFGAGSYDMYIVKLDGSGTLQWSRTVGGTGYESVSSIIQTTDGGYAVAGYTSSFGAGSNDMYIVKLDANGTLQWSRTAGGTGGDLAWSIIQTTDGGYAVAGQTNSFGAGSYDMYIVKLNASGSLQWSKTVGGTNYEEARSIIQTTDGGYAVAGYTRSFGAGNDDMYILKLDASGSLQWSRTVGGTNYDYAFSIIQTTDGGYAAAGYTNSFGAGNDDMYIVKLDGSGSLQWSRTVGGTYEDYALSIIQTTDGGYAAAGYTVSFGAGSNDMYIVKLDGSGAVQWSRTVGGTGTDYASSIIQTTDGEYAAAGWTYSFGVGAGYTDMYIVKLDASGNTCGNSTSPASISGAGGTSTNPSPIVTTPASTVTTPSPTTSTGGTLTTICVIGIQPISNEIPSDFKLEQNYPNPFNNSSKFLVRISKLSRVKISVYDMLGREVGALVNEELKPGVYEVEFDGTNYPSGVYFYQLSAGEFRETKKMVLIK